MRKSLNAEFSAPTVIKFTPTNQIIMPTDADTKYSPAHYKRGSYQIWDFIGDQKLDYFIGNVIKYICRAGHKDYESELDDLLKAKAYIEKKIALVSQSRNQ